MKKLLISIAAIIGMAATVSAQTLIVVEEKPVLTNKRGVPILPQAGDISVGASMTPFFTYFGNMFTRNGDNEAPMFTGNGAGINMKFFTTDRQAIRAGVTVNMGSDYFYGYPGSNTAAGAKVTDQMIKDNLSIGINIGYEWRRGTGRLQGFYGAQLAATYSKSEVNYKYGNAFSASNPTPNTWNFDTNMAEAVAERPTRTIGAPTFSVGVFGFVGVEYFFAPKMSIGGELGLGVSYVNHGESEYRSQSFDTATNTVRDNVVKHHDPSVRTNGLNIRTATTGNIFLSFYF